MSSESHDHHLKSIKFELKLVKLINKPFGKFQSIISKTNRKKKPHKDSVMGFDGKSR